jgi:hypothetical protein
MQGNNGVDCDVFPCLLNGESHSICIVNITGVEYVADPGSQNFFKLGQNGRYEFPWENKGWKLRSGTWSKEGAMGQAFFCKFDKRFDYSAYDRQWYTNLEPSWWDIFINQTPENEEALRDLYEKLKPPY